MKHEVTDTQAPREKQTAFLVCQSTNCHSLTSEKILAALEQEVGERALVKLTGCHGLCQEGPTVLVEPQGTLYVKVGEQDAAEIARAHLEEGTVVERLLYHDSLTGEAVATLAETKFLARQTRHVLAHCGVIDPESIEDYVAAGGYEALGKALSMTPEAVIEETKESGLRGRGGAGFPTGLKWEVARRAQGTEKFVVCNAGVFVARSLMESDPHAVIEGMAISAFAVGAHHGYIYVRAEYPVAARRLELAIQQAKARGTLGESVLGSGFGLELEVVQGAGAFLTGEETALLNFIEGKRGVPRARPPYPAVQGLWGQPTVVNNVETYCNVPLVIGRGAQWFKQVSPLGGTKVFALTGKVVNAGLLEVPLGTTFQEIIYGIGQGLPEGKECKAVAVGGPTGGYLSAAMLDMPAAYDSLTAVGCTMGSSSIEVCDQETCMVDQAKRFFAFCQVESCGKCVPCRLGSTRIANILTRVVSGEGMEGDIERLEELGATLKATALCNLGREAANSVLTTIGSFREEYEAHVAEKRCPALQCKELIAYQILPEKCMGCGICLRSCPVKAITGEKRVAHVISRELCIKCGTCFESCPPKFRAIERVSGEVPAPAVP